MVVQPTCSLCRTWSETPETGFLTTRLKYEEDNLQSTMFIRVCQLLRAYEGLLIIVKMDSAQVNAILLPYNITSQYFIHVIRICCNEVLVILFMYMYLKGLRLSRTEIPSRRAPFLALSKVFVFFFVCFFCVPLCVRLAQHIVNVSSFYHCPYVCYEEEGLVTVFNTSLVLLCINVFMLFLQLLFSVIAFIMPPQTMFVGGYTVFTLSVRPNESPTMCP